MPKGFQPGNSAYKGRGQRRNAAQIAGDMRAGIEAAAKLALVDVANKGIEEFHDEALKVYLKIVRKFYADYKPKVYKRKNTFFGSGASYYDDNNWVNLYTDASGEGFVSGGLRVDPSKIPENWYRNVYASKDGEYKAGSNFPAKYVFAYDFDVGQHGHPVQTTNKNGKSWFLFNVRQATVPSINSTMNRWRREYVADDTKRTELVNKYFYKYLLKYKNKEVKKARGTTAR